MGEPSRLNLLLTHHTEPLRAPVWNQPWYQLVSRLLAPMGVQTFEATSSPQAMDLIERYPIHLAIVDTRLTANDGLALLRIIQKIRQRALVDQQAQTEAGPTGSEISPRRVAVQGESHGLPIPVRFADGQAGDAGTRENRAAKLQAAPGPTVILVTPTQDVTVLQAALSCEAFSVMHEPVDLNLLLDLMARAMKRFHDNQWPR